MTHDKIQQRLIREACEDQPTGWLSNNVSARLSDDGSEIVIETYSGDEAFIDIHHLAGVAVDILEDARKAMVALLSATVEANSGLDSFTRAWAIEQIEKREL